MKWKRYFKLDVVVVINSADSCESGREEISMTTIKVKYVRNGVAKVSVEKM